jgi:hypothetical protein
MKYSLAAATANCHQKVIWVAETVEGVGGAAIDLRELKQRLES